MIALALILAGCGGGDDKVAKPKSEGTANQQDLAARWWNWAASTGEAKNPIGDPTGKFCAEKQPGDVWFLAGSFGDKITRKCKVPKGRQLFAPVLTQVCSPDTVCKFDEPVVSAELDGKALEVVEIDNKSFQVAGIPDNPITYDDVPVDLISTGHWVQFGPLAPGKHTLHLLGKDGTSFTVDVTYTLNVA